MNLQAQMNQQALINRNNNRLILNESGTVYPIRYSGNKMYCYLSTNYRSVSIILDSSVDFQLPQYAKSKSEMNPGPAESAEGIKTDYILTLPDSRVIVFSLRYFANLAKYFVMLIQDETYDYANQITKTFYTPVSYSTVKTPLDNNVERVQIYFCFSPEQFIHKWNNVQTIYDENKLGMNTNLSVNFPGKHNYFDNFIFTVEPNKVISPVFSGRRYERYKPSKQPNSLHEHPVYEEDIKNLVKRHIDTTPSLSPEKPNKMKESVKVMHTPRSILKKTSPRTRNVTFDYYNNADDNEPFTAPPRKS